MKVKQFRVVALVLGLSLMLPLAGSSQSPPWTLTFTASSDHSAVAQQVPVVDRYELLLAPVAGGTAPAPINLGKPAPNAQNLISVNIDAQLLALPAGSYTGRVRAVGPGGEGVSAPSDPFSLVVPAPSAAGKPAISR